MKGVSQFLIAVRLLSTTDKFSGQLTLFMESGRIQLSCLGERVLLVEIGDLFPASWLAQNNMTPLAGQIRNAASVSDKVEGFRAITEKPEIKSVFVNTLKKHLADFFSTEIRKCELKSESLPSGTELFTLYEMASDCAANLMSSFSYQELLPSNEVSFQVSGDYVERSARMKITLQQGYLLSRLDRPQTISEILATIPADEDTTRRSLIVLWAFGVLDSNYLNRFVPRVEVTGKGSGSVASVPISEKMSDDLQRQIEMIEQTYTSLAYKDYYTLLGVTTQADLPEVKAAYYRLARKFHPDRYYGLEDLVVKEKIDIIFSTINVAYETLKNSRARQAYDNSNTDDKRISPSKITSDSPAPKGDSSKVAEDYYQRAQKSFSSRNFYEAVQFLRSATQISPDVPKYWRQLGVVLLKNDQWRKEAEDSFNRAVDLEPHNGENHLYLAFLYKNSGLKLRARRCFAKVLELDPRNDVAKDQLEELDLEEGSGAQKKGILDGIFKKK